MTTQTQKDGKHPESAKKKGEKKKEAETTQTIGEKKKPTNQLKYYKYHRKKNT